MACIIPTFLSLALLSSLVSRAFCACNFPSGFVTGNPQFFYEYEASATQQQPWYMKLGNDVIFEEYSDTSSSATVLSTETWTCLNLHLTATNDVYYVIERNSQRRCVKHTVVNNHLLTKERVTMAASTLGQDCVSQLSANVPSFWQPRRNQETALDCPFVSLGYAPFYFYTLKDSTSYPTGYCLSDAPGANHFIRNSRVINIKACPDQGLPKTRELLVDNTQLTCLAIGDGGLVDLDANGKLLLLRVVNSQGISYFSGRSKNMQFQKRAQLSVYMGTDSHPKQAEVSTNIFNTANQYTAFFDIRPPGSSNPGAPYPTAPPNMPGNFPIEWIARNWFSEGGSGSSLTTVVFGGDGKLLETYPPDPPNRPIPYAEESQVLGGGFLASDSYTRTYLMANTLASDIRKCVGFYSTGSSDTLFYKEVETECADHVHCDALLDQSNQLETIIQVPPGGGYNPVPATCPWNEPSNSATCGPAGRYAVSLTDTDTTEYCKLEWPDLDFSDADISDSQIKIDSCLNNAEYAKPWQSTLTCIGSTPASVVGSRDTSKGDFVLLHWRGPTQDYFYCARWKCVRDQQYGYQQYLRLSLQVTDPNKVTCDVNMDNNEHGTSSTSKHISFLFIHYQSPIPTFCSSSPCLNGGTCEVPNQRCLCTPNYRGDVCEINTVCPCLNGGTCNYATPPALDTCSCVTGYTGPSCETLIGACPCMNGGSCISGTSPPCNCVGGWTGQICDVPLTGTSDCPCFNFGDCVTIGTNEKCNCKTGYTGRQCETPTNCPCVNGGVCNGAVTPNTCICPPGYSGNSCQHSSPCPCQNGGTCSTTAPYICSCPVEYAGASCENLLVCPCLNGGTCVTTPTLTQSCVCRSGWAGIRCHERTDGTNACGCMNGGACTVGTGPDGATTYYCGCPTHTSGTYCEILLPHGPCTTMDISKQCAGGNTQQCVDVPGSPPYHFCQCVNGWTGPLCRTNQDNCFAGACQNGGTCYDEIGGYSCACPAGWSGNQCQVQSGASGGGGGAGAMDMTIIVALVIAFAFIIFAVVVIALLLCYYRNQGNAAAMEAKELCDVCDDGSVCTSHASAWYPEYKTVDGTLCKQCN